MHRIITQVIQMVSSRMERLASSLKVGSFNNPSHVNKHISYIVIPRCFFFRARVNSYLPSSRFESFFQLTYTGRQLGISRYYMYRCDLTMKAI